MLSEVYKSLLPHPHLLFTLSIFKKSYISVYTIYIINLLFRFNFSHVQTKAVLQNFVQEYGYTIEDVRSFNAKITFMTEDAHIPGNYLIVVGYSVLTTPDFIKLTRVGGFLTSSDYQEGVTSLAKFGKIEGVVSMNTYPNKVWVADSDFSCIRVIDRVQYKTAEFAGKCKKFTRRDGTLNIAGIQRISSLVYYAANAMIFLDNNRRSIRKLSKIDQLNLWKIKTIHTATININSLAVHPESKRVFMLRYRNISRVISGNREVFVLGGPFGNHSDGTFTTSLVRNPQNMLFLSNDTFLIADYGNHVIRVANLKTSRVTTLCLPQFSTPYEVKEGSIQECKLIYPMQLYNNAEQKRIYIISKDNFHELIYKGK